MVQAGYQKGASQAGQNLVFEVMATPGTASEVTLKWICLVWQSIWPIAGEGVSFDYTVNTNQVRALFNRPTPPDNVVFTFRIDAIAQEPNETLFLELVPTATTTLPSGDAVFFRNTLNISIIDSDSKRMFGKSVHIH